MGKKIQVVATRAPRGAASSHGRPARFATSQNPSRFCKAPRHAPPRTVVLLVLAFLCAAVVPAAEALPEGRHYEMVSPVYKAGYGASVSFPSTVVAPDGNTVSFISLGGFAGILSGAVAGGNRYVAQRGATGWSTASVAPPTGTFIDFSTDLGETLAQASVSPNAVHEEHLFTELEYLLHENAAPEATEAWGVFGGFALTVAGSPNAVPRAIEDGATPDLCHVVIAGEQPLTPGIHKTGELYDISRGCEGEPYVQPVAVKNTLNSHHQPVVINPICHTTLGLSNNVAHHQQNNINAIADGGREIFFDTSLAPSSSCGAPFQVFVRLGGERTLEVSKPIGESCSEVPCEPGAGARPSAFFAGASEDGSKVFFTTTADLTGTGQPGEKLYMARLGCPPAEPECVTAGKTVTSLQLLSSDPHTGESPDVHGVVRSATDGSHVYFVASGALEAAANDQGQMPAGGADNLYVYDTQSGTLAFIADLCSGPELSGGAHTLSCPTDLRSGEQGSNDESLWAVGGGEAQLNSCPQASAGCEAGRFMVFSTYARLTSDDTDAAKDVYRYDALTGALDRVSVGEDGADANGNDSGFAATITVGRDGSAEHVFEQYELADRAIAEDGSPIVFSSSGPLSPKVSNTVANIYEWQQGHVALISSGSSEEPDSDPVVSASGDDIFFTTSENLLPQDADGLADVYDARVGGGFPAAPIEPQRCSSDACQGALSSPAPLLVPGSISQAPGENLAAATPPSAPPPGKAKAKRRCARGRRLLHGKCVKISAKRRAAHSGGKR